MVCNILHIILFFLSTIICIKGSYESLYIDFITEEDALVYYKDSSHTLVTSQDIKLSITKGWWSLAKKLVERTHNQGIDLSRAVREETLNIKKQLDELNRLLNKKHAEITLLSPAFQWAQSPDQIFLQIKFTYRWNAPGALNVENELVDISNNTFYFTGIGSHSHEKKKYELKLVLFDEIDSEKSEWSFGSVGKLICTLSKKESNKTWPRLLYDDKLKIPNMHVWWEMKEKLELKEKNEQLFKSKNESKILDLNLSNETSHFNQSYNFQNELLEVKNNSSIESTSNAHIVEEL